MALDLQRAFGSSETASVDGVWVPLDGDAKVKVARVGHPQAIKAYRRLPRHIQIAIERADPESGQVRDYLVQYMAEHILRDWENLADGLTKEGKDKTLKYSVENAKLMLRKYRRFRDRIWEIANDEDLFNTEMAEDAKN